MYAKGLAQDNITHKLVPRGWPGNLEAAMGCTAKTATTSETYHHLGRPVEPMKEGATASSFSTNPTSSSAVKAP